MTLHLQSQPRAECDREEIFEYLAVRSLTAAQRFVDRLKETLARLSDQPVPGMPFISDNPRLTGLRWTKVRDFPNYLIFFRVSGNNLVITRVLHGARDIESILGQ